MKAGEREHFSLFNSYKFLNYRFILEECVKKGVTKNGLLLDAGCGRGNSIFFPPKQLEIIGIDVLRANVIISKLRWNKRAFVVADLTMLPFIDSAFEGALSADVLEHIDDKVRAIKELARVTEQGGFFVGCSSNILNPILWLDAKMPILTKPLAKKLAGPGHYDRHSRFSPSTLVKTLKLTGYQLNHLYLLGFPQFTETFTTFGLILSGIWRFLDMFTNRKNLSYLKEILLWHATRL